MQPNVESYYYPAVGEPIADILRRYNLTLEEINTVNGTNFQAGDILIQDIYLPPDKVEPIFDDGGRIIEFVPTTEAPPPPPMPFDPDQATSDWLSVLYRDDAESLAGQEYAMRQDMLVNAYVLMHYTNAWDGDIPTPEAFIQAFAHVPSEEIATFSAEVSSYAQAQFNAESAEYPNAYSFSPSFVTLPETLEQYGMKSEGGHGLSTIEYLATQSIAYLSVTGLDELRQDDHAWDPVHTRSELNSLIWIVPVLVEDFW